ncbi:SDR family NAD(P)-dependent oxidoreductase [Sphingosinicella soli]|uniref:Nucleoside-diphosphate-sugar epimerase n=1 Tax=Sphingosinicella soli TaxID=333708 RepID=A0A7W7B4E2_9SPHN|nr:SDR family NAD(P)-dependent oxidoreductase [Sphingosinicella soli]MBB4633821.1 nucleoside-diphosphate-sugar epimerase [Sphingosinicella soli]
MPHLLILGQGYTGSRLRAALERQGWTVTGTARTARPGIVAADDPGVVGAIANASHIVSSVPPEGDHDPVLLRHGAALAASGVPLLYLSSTGVYGDTGGAWVDETAPVGHGRRSARSAADLTWQGMGARVLRLPGIYGPGRSALERVRAGTAQRIDAGGQVFSRVHVDDVVAAVIAAFGAGPGVWNIGDDLPAPGHEVTAFACRLAGAAPPPLIPVAEARLSPPARGFYAESRRVANGKMKRDLGIRLRYPDYRSGLRACLEDTA